MRFRGAARWDLVGYAALTIALYFLDNPGMSIGYVDKVIEVALIALLLAEAYLARSEPQERYPGHARQARNGALGVDLALLTVCPLWAIFSCLSLYAGRNENRI